MTTNLLSVIEQLVGALEEWERVDVLGREPHIHRESWKQFVQDRNIKHTAALAAGKQALEQTQREVTQMTAAEKADVKDALEIAQSVIADDFSDITEHSFITLSRAILSLQGQAMHGRLRGLEDVAALATVGSTYPELMEYLQSEIEKAKTHPQATEPAPPSDAELLDFIEEHPHLALRKHKNRWSFVGLTNYEYPTFETAREAIKAALVASTY